MWRIIVAVSLGVVAFAVAGSSFLALLVGGAAYAIGAMRRSP